MRKIYKQSATEFICKTVIFGALLSSGAPLGYLLFGYYFSNPDQLTYSAWLTALWNKESALLFYLTIPTLLFFSLFGFITGRQKYQLALQARQMDEFLHIAAHDIRSPIAVIQQASSMFREDMGANLDKHSVQMLEMIERQTGMIIELLTELLDINKMEAGRVKLEKKNLDPQELVQRAFNEMELLIQKKSGRVNVSSDLPVGSTVNADPFRLRQVIRNIVGNAIKYMLSSSSIDAHLFINSLGETEITISNQGPKIPSENLKTIFDKYTQARVRDYKLGYGLGLAICKNIIDLHGGRIWAENSPDGVRIHFTLPAKE